MWCSSEYTCIRSVQAQTPEQTTLCTVHYSIHITALHTTSQKFKFSQLVISSLVQLGAELGAHAVSHLENVSEAGIEAMAQAGVVGVLLPTTAYILRLHPPPARRMIEKGWLSHY